MSKLDKVHKKLHKSAEQRALEARYDRKVIPQTVTIIKAFFLLALRVEGFGFIRALRVLNRVAQFERDAAAGHFTIQEAVDQVELEYKGRIRLAYKEGDYQEDHVILKEDTKKC